MTERKIELDRQRLAIRTALGDEFAAALKSQFSEEDGSAAAQVSRHLAEHPETQIIGARMEEGGRAEDLLNKLYRQLGLPPTDKPKLGRIKDRLAGREDDFLLIVTGAGNLSPSEQKKLSRRIGGLGLAFVIEG